MCSNVVRLFLLPEPPLRSVKYAVHKKTGSLDPIVKGSDDNVTHLVLIALLKTPDLSTLYSLILLISVVHWLGLPLSNGASWLGTPHLKMGKDPTETLYPGLKYQTMGKVKKASNTKNHLMIFCFRYKYSWYGTKWKTIFLWKMSFSIHCQSSKES